MVNCVIFISTSVNIMVGVDFTVDNDSCILKGIEHFLHINCTVLHSHWPSCHPEVCVTTWNGCTLCNWLIFV